MKILQARSSFIVLQVLDLVTTLIAFHYGAFELNPLVARLTTLLGPVGGVLCRCRLLEHVDLAGARASAALIDFSCFKTELTSSQLP